MSGRPVSMMKAWCQFGQFLETKGEHMLLAEEIGKDFTFRQQSRTELLQSPTGSRLLAAQRRPVNGEVDEEIT